MKEYKEALRLLTQMKMRNDSYHKARLSVGDKHYWRALDNAKDRHSELLDLIRCDLSYSYETLHSDDSYSYGRIVLSGVKRHNLMVRDEFYKKYSIGVDKDKQ